MRTEYRDDPTVDTADLPYGWHKGDTCVMITNKAKRALPNILWKAMTGYILASEAYWAISPGISVEDVSDERGGH